MPHNPFAQHDLGLELAGCGDYSNAVPHLIEAVRLLPNGFDREYSAVNLNYAVADAYYQLKLYAPKQAGLWGGAEPQPEAPPG